jgi:hypothetical protein
MGPSHAEGARREHHAFHLVLLRRPHHMERTKRIVVEGLLWIPAGPGNRPHVDHGFGLGNHPVHGLPVTEIRLNVSGPELLRLLLLVRPQHFLAGVVQHLHNHPAKSTCCSRNKNHAASTTRVSAKCLLKESAPCNPKPSSSHSQSSSQLEREA